MTLRSPPSSSVFIPPAPAVSLSLLSSPPPPSSHFLFPFVFLTSPLSVSLFFSGMNHESESCVVDGPFSSAVPCCKQRQRKRERWGIDLRAYGRRTIGPLLKPLWSTNAFPAASRCQRETREEEKGVKKQLCFLSLHLSALAAGCPEGREEGERRRRMPDLGTP